MTELEDYYKSEIYEEGMPLFEDLKHWQRSQMVNGGHFNRWKARKSFEALRAHFFNALGIPHLIAWLSKFIK